PGWCDRHDPSSKCGRPRPDRDIGPVNAGPTRCGVEDHVIEAMPRSMLEVSCDVDDHTTRRDREREPLRVRSEVRLREVNGSERMIVIAAEVEHPIAEVFDHGPAR